MEKLQTNNCPICKCRIFITSGGCAECSDIPNKCPNWLRPLGYVENG